MTAYFTLLLLALFISSVQSECDVDGPWMREYSFGMKGDVTIKWNFTDDTITMLMIGRAKGWVALGFGSTTSLNGSDIVIGWVDNDSKVHLQDRYGNDKNQSLIDDENSYTVLDGKENETSTFICWTRKLNTCNNQDYPITFSTVRVSYAFAKEDPQKDDFDVPEDLGETKGVHSLHLLSLEYPFPESTNIKSVDIRAKNVTISPVDSGTVYWCTHLTIKKSKKTHMIATDPIVTEGMEGILHHFLVYECPGSLLDKLSWLIPEEGYDCFDPVRFIFQDACIIPINGWGMGGTRTVFPPDIGFKFHDDRNRYFMLQSHYNVRSMKTARRDNSGLRFYYTDELREIEAAEAGFVVNVTPFHLIPPKQKNFANVGVCSDKCTKNAISDEGMKVFSVFFHTHLTGRKVRLRRIRNGTELEPIADEAFDFDFQQIIMLNKEFTIEKGDLLTVECDYDTSDRNFTTVGAFGTYEEMCIVVIFYTPPSNLTWCGSMLKPLEVMNLTGVKALLPLPKMCWGKNCESIYNEQGVADYFARILFPLKAMGTKLIDYYKNYTWSDSQIETLKNMYYEDQIILCKTQDYYFNSSDTDFVSYPKNFIPYKMPDICQSGND